MSSIGRRLASLERRDAQASASTRCPDCADDAPDAVGCVPMRLTFEGDEDAGRANCGTCGRALVMRLTFDDAVAALVDDDLDDGDQDGGRDADSEDLQDIR